MIKCTTATITIVGILTLTACNSISSTPDTDTRFGMATGLIKSQQTLNPEASLNTNPVAGIDGKAAKGAMDQYRKSFGETKQVEGRSPAISVSPNANSTNN